MRDNLISSLDISKRSNEIMRLGINHQKEKAYAKDVRLFNKFLSDNGRLHIRITENTVINFLSWRSFKKSDDWLHLESIIAIRKNIGVYLNKKKYVENPALGEKVDIFVRGYKEKMLSIGKCTNLTPPASPSAIDCLLRLIADERSDESRKVHFILCVAKQSGARAGDILRIKRSQVKIKDNCISLRPTRYKKAKTNKSWQITCYKTSNSFDCPITAFKNLPSESSDLLLPNLTTAKLDKILYKYENQIGERVTVHRIRVTVVFLMTAAGYSDDEIMCMLNWQSHESLKRYRWGVDLNQARGKSLLGSIWDNHNDKSLAKEMVKDWILKLK